jgi:cytochrome c
VPAPGLAAIEGGAAQTRSLTPLRCRVVLACMVVNLTACAAYTPQDFIDRGRQLAQSNCARCHAIGSEGGSPNAFAPEFRDLRETRSLVDIEQTFAPGQINAHPPMPNFAGTPEDTHALLDYIESVQTPPSKPWPRRIWK